MSFRRNDDTTVSRTSNRRPLYLGSNMRPLTDYRFTSVLSLQRTEVVRNGFILPNNLI